MRLHLRCVCRHGYGTHELRPVGTTLIPTACRARACLCVLYERKQAA